MALDICFDLKTFLEFTCRTCSRYFSDAAGGDEKMKFHRIFAESATHSSSSSPRVGNDEHEIQGKQQQQQPPQPSDDVREIYAELDIWKLNINPTDGLPQQICDDCMNRFRSVKLFREECLDTQKVLQSYFKDFDTLLESASLGRLSPKSESIKSEPRGGGVIGSPAPSSFNADDLVEEVPESPERQQHSPFCCAKFNDAVYAESSMGTPPPLFEEIKTEPIDMQTMEYLKSGTELQLDIGGQPKSEIKQEDDDEMTYNSALAKTPTPLAFHFTSSDDESSTPTTDNEQADSDASSDNDESDGVAFRSPVNTRPLYPRQNPLQCKICFVVFTKRTQLREHHERVHPQEKPYMCNICSSAFKTNFLLSQHKLKHNRPDAFKCSLCAKHFRSQLHLQRHAKNFHLTSTYTCHICNEKFEKYTQFRFQYHVRQHGEKRFHCQFCDKSFHQKIHLANHERTHTKEQPFQCNICGKAYRQQTACREHMLTHNDPTPFKCKICHKGFTQRSSLRLHYRTHNNKPFNCELCGQSFAQKARFELHQQTHHDGGPSYICQHCDAAYKKQSHLEAHMQALHAMKCPLTCGYCGKSFAFETSLKTHMQSTHTQHHKAFKCQYCDKTFQKKHLHLLHEQQQHEEQNVQQHYECNFCSETFAFPTALGQHMLSHLEEQSGCVDLIDYPFGASM